MAGPRAWRLRIRDQSTIAAPDGTIDEFVFSTVKGVGASYIADVPDADGAQIDPLTGAPSTAQYRIRVIDASETAVPAGLVPGPGSPGGIITGALGDKYGRNQRLSRRAFLELSSDEGATWPEMAVAGYVMRLDLVEAGVYEWTIGDARRVETATTVFKTLSPGFERGTCVLGGPIGGFAPQVTQTSPTMLPAPFWSSGPNYVLGTCVTGGPSDSTQYICVGGNHNTPPPNATYWEALPPGTFPSGVWVAPGNYTPGIVVVWTDGQAYLCIVAPPSHEPPSNLNYWLPLTAILLPGWGMIQDYGGVLCTVLQTGATTQSLKIRVDAGFWKQPVKQPGDLPWRYAKGANIPWDFSSANALIPGLCSQYGPSPNGYGGTFLSPGPGTIFGGGGVPKGAPTTQKGGATDPVLGDLGWVIGGIVCQVRLPTGQVVSVNAYPQFYNNSILQGARYTKTPVLIYGSAIKSDAPGARTILIDWHDFYRRDANLNPVAPVDQFGQSVAMPATGATFTLKAVVLPIGPDTPVHVADHPIDLWCKCAANAGIQWDDTSVGVVSPVRGDASWTPTPTGTGVRAAVGADLVFVGRITQAMTLPNLWTNIVGGPLGIAQRKGATGKVEMVLTRTPPTDLPEVTWTDADVYGEPGSEPTLFDLDEGTRVGEVDFAYKTFLAWDSTLNANRALDDVVEVNSTAPFIDNDFAAYGTSVQSYTLPGGYGSASVMAVDSMAQFGAALANRIFERYGRGAVQVTIDILADSPQVAVGDLVIVQSARMPNPATNQRGGPRLCIATKKTPQPEGYEYVLQDLGAAEQPAALAPTFTLLADPFDPLHIVDVTVTNLAAMQAAYPQGILAVEYAVSASAPGAGVGGILALDAALSDLGAATFALPPAQMGATVQVRMHVRGGPGQLPSVWAGWTAVTLDQPDTITNLTTVDVGEGVVDVEWVNIDPTTPIQVWLTPGIPQGVTPTVGTVFLSLSAFPMQAGTTVSLGATAYDLLGNPMTGLTFTWDTANHAIATASAGLITGVAPGSTTVTATTAGVTGTATVTVTPGSGVTIDHLTIFGSSPGAPYGAQIFAGDRLAASFAAARAGTAPQAAALTLLRTDANAVAARRNSLATLAAYYPTGYPVGQLRGSLHVFACPGEYYYESPNPGAGHPNAALAIQGIIGNDATAAFLTALRGFIDNVDAPAATDIVRAWAVTNTSVNKLSDPPGFGGNDGPLLMCTCGCGILMAACLLDEALRGNWSAVGAGWNSSDRTSVESWIVNSLYPMTQSVVGPFVSGQPSTGMTNNWRSWALFIWALCGYYLQGNTTTPSVAATGTAMVGACAAALDAAIIADINATGTQAGGFHEELLRTGRTTHYDYYSFLPLACACQVIFMANGPNEWTKQSALLQSAGNFLLNRILNIGSLSPSEGSDFPPFFPELFEGLFGVYGTQAYATYAAKSRPNMPGGTLMQHMSLYSAGTLTALINATQPPGGSGTAISALTMVVGTPTTVVSVVYDSTGAIVDGRTVNYTSSDTGKATVGLTSGTITPVGAGPATITATDTVSGKTATLALTVTATFTTLAGAAHASGKKATLSVNINYAANAPYNVLYPRNWAEVAGAGGQITEEVCFQDRYLMSGATSATAPTFTLASANAQIAKAKAQGTAIRAYLFQAIPAGCPWYATYVKDAPTATQAITAIVTGTIGAWKTAYGDSAHGGVSELVIGDRGIQPAFGSQSGYATCPWFTYLGQNWIGIVAAQVLAIDPGIKIILNVGDGIQYAAGTVQRAYALSAFSNLISFGVPTANLIFGIKHDMDAALGFTAADAAALDGYLSTLDAKGTKWAPTECDMKDDTQLGVTQATGAPIRQATSRTTWAAVQAVWAKHWTTCAGVGITQLSAQTSRYNNPPNASPPYTRSDGLFQYPTPLDENYNRMTGLEGAGDVYAAFLDFLTAMAS